MARRCSVGARVVPVPGAQCGRARLSRMPLKYPQEDRRLTIVEAWVRLAPRCLINRADFDLPSGERTRESREPQGSDGSLIVCLKRARECATE